MSAGRPVISQLFFLLQVCVAQVYSTSSLVVVLVFHVFDLSVGHFHFVDFDC
eukprot:m.10727 g.10727  ORF g.10727 m.10727 type:complete len:52 (+) comp22601_c0_seq1:328-483(+)